MPVLNPHFGGIGVPDDRDLQPAFSSALAAQRADLISGLCAARKVGRKDSRFQDGIENLIAGYALTLQGDQGFQIDQNRILSPCDHIFTMQVSGAEKIGQANQNPCPLIESLYLFFRRAFLKTDLLLPAVIRTADDFDSHPFIPKGTF